MNLSEIEHAITSHEEPYTYTRTWVDPPVEVQAVRPFDWHSLWCEDIDPTNIPGVGLVEREATHGGEGEGDEAWVVLKVTEDDGTVRYFRKEGWYASHDGVYFDGEFFEVVPRQVEVTRYVKA